MPAPLLSEAQCRDALDALARHGTVTAAAAALNLPRGTFDHRLREAQRRGITRLPTTALPRDDAQAIPEGFPYEEAWRTWERAIGVLERRYAGPCRRPVSADPRVRVVAAGDFHAPFYDPDAVARLIAREADRTDVLVIGGDFTDGYAASRFTPTKRVTFEQELAGATFLLERLSEKFPRIIFLKGSNHPDRYEKRLRESLAPDLVEAILYITGGILSPELALVKRFANVEIGAWVHGGREYPWFCLLGDVLVSHAQKSSRVPGASLRGVHEWLTDFEHILGLPKFRACIQFHTHTQTLFPYKADAMLIEAGAMCQVPEYSTSDRVAGRPQRTGYVTFDLVANQMDMDSIRLVWLDEIRRRDAA